MLGYLREMSNKLIAKVLIGILMFSFVGWGVAEWVLNGSSSETTIVRVGKTKITPNQFVNEKSKELVRMSKAEQKQVYTDPEFANAFTQNILKNLINNAMIENRAADLGFIVTDKRIVREIRNFPEFQQNGKFSAEKFMRLLNNSGFTEDQFAEYLRAQILRSMVLGSLAVPTAVSDFEVKSVYNSRYGEKAIEYATVNFSDFNVATPGDEKLREFYKQNPKMISESRVVSYILVSAQMDKPDSYDAGYTRAQKMEDAIVSGDSMSAAAKGVNAKFVSIPAFARAKIPADQLLTDSVVSKIFSMDQGMESEIMETKQGFVIMRVEKINPEHIADFNSARDSLVSAWKTSEQKKQAYLRANSVLVDLNKTNVLKDKKSATVSRMSGAPTDVLVAAFANETGINSIVPGKNAFYVLHVGKFVAPKSDANKIAALRKELAGMKTRQIMSDYNSFLGREYPVKINERVLNKMFGQKQQY